MVGVGPWGFLSILIPKGISWTVEPLENTGSQSDRRCSRPQSRPRGAQGRRCESWLGDRRCTSLYPRGACPQRTWRSGGAVPHLCGMTSLPPGPGRLSGGRSLPPAEEATIKVEGGRGDPRGSRLWLGCAGQALLEARIAERGPGSRLQVGRGGQGALRQLQGRGRGLGMCPGGVSGPENSRDTWRYKWTNPRPGRHGGRGVWAAVLTPVLTSPVPPWQPSPGEKRGPEGVRADLPAPRPPEPRPPDPRPHGRAETSAVPSKTLWTGAQGEMWA